MPRAFDTHFDCDSVLRYKIKQRSFRSMKKKLLILIGLVVILSMALSFTALCYAEDELPVAQEDGLSINQIEVQAEPFEAKQEEAVVEETTDEEEAKAWFVNVWEKGKAWVIGACSGLSMSLIVGAIVSVLIKRATNKGFDKLEKQTDSATIADLASQKILHNLSAVNIDVNIKPLLESHIRAIYEQINDELTTEMQKQDKKNLAIIECFEAFADYFKCSTAITDEQKQALSEKIASAKALYANCDNKVSAQVEIKAEPTKTEIKTKKVQEAY